MSGLRQCWRCGHAGRPGWRLAFAYDAGTVTALKAAVPHEYRIWDAEQGEWWVDSVHEAAVLALFPEFEAFLKQPRLL